MKFASPFSVSNPNDYCGVHQPCSQPPNHCRNEAGGSWKCTCAEGWQLQVIDGKERCIGNIFQPEVSMQMALNHCMAVYSPYLFAFSDIDECTGSPCELGTCQNEPGGYACVCPLGYVPHESIPNQCEGV